MQCACFALKRVVRATPGATEQGSYYYHADHLGSSSVVTDSNGKFYEQIEYFPYGETWVHNKANTEQTTTPYKLTSKELDEETGLYYYGARYYDARLSRWVSDDPPLARGDYFPVPPINDKAKEKNSKLPGMGGVFNPINLDAYHYAGNNPVKLVDPDGNSDYRLDAIYWKLGITKQTEERISDYLSSKSEYASGAMAGGLSSYLGTDLFISPKNLIDLLKIPEEYQNDFMEGYNQGTKVGSAAAYIGYAGAMKKIMIDGGKGLTAHLIKNGVDKADAAEFVKGVINALTPSIKKKLGSKLEAQGYLQTQIILEAMKAKEVLEQKPKK